MVQKKKKSINAFFKKKKTGSLVLIRDGAQSDEGLAVGAATCLSTVFIMQLI